MDKLIAWFAKNSVAANLLMFGLLVAGVIGYLNVEREVFPIFEANQVEINVPWPGAAPQEVEEQVVIRIEEALKDLDNIDRVNSFAAEGFGRIVVRALGQVDMAEFVNDVKLRVDSVNSLPRDIEPPVVRQSVFRNEMMRLAVHGNVGEKRLTDMAENIRDEVAALPNISIVELFGARSEEVAIELSEEAMRRYGLSFDQVSAVIRANSLNLSSGSVRTATGDVQLRARNMANNQQDFDSIILRQSEDGGVVLLGDVAKVIDGYEENEILATLNGEPAVLVQVMTTDSMDIVAASRSMNEWLVKRQENMPEGMSLTLWWDSADVYNNRMDTIVSAALSGLLLVFLVLILTLRPQVALWVTVGIGVAFVGTLAFLPAYDVSMNVMSTFAFLLVLGIVVDDAIVVGESIHHHGADHGGGVESAVEGTKAVAKPVIFAVLTTIVAFMPWMFLSGESVQITRMLSIVITAALVISLVEAFLILPAHLRKLRPRKDLHGLARTQQKIAHSLVRFADTTYRGWLEKAIKYRGLTISIFISFFIISLGVFSTGWVRFSFNPEIESDQVIINVEMPSGSPYSRALEVLDQLQTAEKQLEAEVNQNAEGGSGELIENWYTRSRRDSVIAIVKLAPPEVRELSAKETAKRLSELVGEVPDAESVSVEYTMNDGGQRINYSLQHKDLDTLREAVAELEMQLQSYDSIFFVRNNMQGSADELRLSLLPGAEKLGVDLASVSRQVRQAYYGEEVQRLPRANGDVRVMLRYPKSARHSLDSLDDFRIRTADGREVPLFSVAEVEYAPGIKSINRRNGNRSAYIDAELSGDVRKDIMDDMEKNFLEDWKARYPGLSVNKAGQAEGEAQFMKEIASLYFLALFGMYALLAVAFKSYFKPIIIMTAIPFGFMGAVYGHLIFDTSMALFSYFGIGAAAGVVVNDNLVLMDYIGKQRQKGMSVRDAVIAGGVNRFRPILLTSITTFIGLMPMLAERSAQAQFLHPAVIALAFGVLFALFVSLLLVPALYSLGASIKSGVLSWFGIHYSINGEEDKPAEQGEEALAKS
ncbi:efflux RND transporter permease subunit [uncultured Pseudoteredinibacter sp.]|uniref:efflux RND transporter permease subunit n=1 Tax=uncultured Pseudoteredinibacter sp. TaxID=1641701 RepID=UPI0026181543|nr:efflux RND transporter permease subunit [uncultured Pseudoteredinibacter sp.]